MGVGGLQRPAPHLEKKFGHWGREGHKMREKPGYCVCRGKEMQKNHRSGRFIRDAALQTLGVPVQKRWCIGSVH